MNVAPEGILHGAAGAGRGPGRAMPIAEASLVLPTGQALGDAPGRVPPFFMNSPSSVSWPLNLGDFAEAHGNSSDPAWGNPGQGRQP